MAKQTVVAFYGIGFRFGLRMKRLGNKRLIWLPVVTHDTLKGVMLHPVPQLFPGDGVPGTQYAVEKSLCISINSNPDPTGVFFAPM